MFCIQFAMYLLPMLWMLTASIVLGSDKSYSRCTGSTISRQLYQHISRVSELAAISYCVGRQGIQKPFNCFNRCNHFPEIVLSQTWDTGILFNSCGFIAYSDDKQTNNTTLEIFVVFRGTSSLSNIVSDLEATHADYTRLPTNGKDQCTNCTVHSGFMAAWNATRSLIQPQLRILREIYPEHQLILIGHSLGGAIAGIAGLEMRSTGNWGNIEVVTFGEPMWGNFDTARFVDDVFGCRDWETTSESCRYRRVVNHRDPVPDLPPADWGWTAHGGEIVIMQDGLAPQREDVFFCRGRDSSEISTEVVPTVDMAISSPLNFGDSARPQHSKDLSEQRPLHPVPEVSWPLGFPHREYFVGMGVCFDIDWS